MELRKFVAEMIGTFFLCFAGISAIVCTQPPISSGAGLVGIAFAHGLALSIGVAVTGGVSGGHLNPAVTIAMLATGRIKVHSAIGYILFQLIGATLAAFICASVLPPGAVHACKLGIPLPPEQAWVTNSVIILYEAVMTFLLVTAVFATAVDERGKAVKIGAFAIGLTVAFDILAGGPVTGASMNPARSFGPALMFADFNRHWCYWVGPVLGGLFAGLLYHHFLLKED